MLMSDSKMLMALWGGGGNGKAEFLQDCGCEPRSLGIFTYYFIFRARPKYLTWQKSAFTAWTIGYACKLKPLRLLYVDLTSWLGN